MCRHFSGRPYLIDHLSILKQQIIYFTHDSVGGQKLS